MIKQHCYQILFFLATILALPLHAAQYLEQDQGKNDSQQAASNRNSSLANSNYTRKESKMEIDNKVEPEDFKKKKKDLEQALAINKKHYGADHPHTASTMVNLGTLLTKLGSYTSAKNYLEKALKINMQHYGSDHPNTANTIGQFGQCA